MKIHNSCLTAGFEELHAWLLESIPFYLQSLDEIDLFIHDQNLYASVDHSTHHFLIVSNDPLQPILLQSMLKKMGNPAITKSEINTLDEAVSQLDHSNLLLFFLSNKNNPETSLDLITSIREGNTPLPSTISVCVFADSTLEEEFMTYQFNEMNIHALSKVVLRMLDWRELESSFLQLFLNHQFTT